MMESVQLAVLREDCFNAWIAWQHTHLPSSDDLPLVSAPSAVNARVAALAFFQYDEVWYTDDAPALAPLSPTHEYRMTV